LYTLKKKRKVGKRKEETSSSINKSLINVLFNIDVTTYLAYSFLTISNAIVIVIGIEASIDLFNYNLLEVIPIPPLYFFRKYIFSYLFIIC